MSTSPHPHTILFARGVLARLALWPALRLAVHASWGGPASAEKQRWFAGVLVDQFEAFIVASTSASASTTSSSLSASSASRATLAPDEAYVEELLLQIMADEFDVMLEDDSASAVAKDIVKLFEAACVGDETYVKELEVQAERIKGKVPTYEKGEGSESDWEDEDDEEESEEESVPRLLNHPETRTRDDVDEQVDEDGFTLVRNKRR